MSEHKRTLSTAASVVRKVGRRLERRAPDAVVRAFYGAAMSAPGEVGEEGFDREVRYLAATGRVEDARHTAARWLARFPRSADAAYRLGLHSENTGRIEDAVEAYGRAVVLSGDAQYLYRRGWARARLGRTTLALEDLWSAARADEPDRRALGRIKEILDSTKASLREKYECLLEGAELHAFDRKWQGALYQAALELEEVDVARTALERMVDGGIAKEREFYALGRLLDQAGDQVAAKRWYAEAVRVRPAKDRQFGIGALLADKGDWNAAAAAYREHTNLPSDEGEFYYRAGMAHDRIYAWQDAEHYYALALERDPGRVYSLWRMAFVLERQHKYLEAAHYYRLYAEKERGPRHRGRYDAGRVLVLAGRPRAACREFAQIPGMPTVGVSTAHARQLARSVTSTLEGRAPAPHLRSCGEALLRLGDPEAAAPYFAEAAARSDDHHAVDYYGQALALARSGDYTAAAELYLQTEIFRHPSGVGDRTISGSSERLRATYIAFSETLDVDEGTVLYEVGHGSSISCNPLALFRQAVRDPRHAALRHVWVVEDGVSVPSEVLDHPRTVIVRRESELYLRYLATAAFLVNNTSFASYFVRRPEQRYLNTWHGTPLKFLGRGVRGEFLNYGNIARNLLHVTHLAVANEWTARTLMNEHGVDAIFTGAVLTEGSPRNDVLSIRSERVNRRVQTRLGLAADDKVVVFAPTWRGRLDAVGGVEFDIDGTIDVLEAIEAAGFRPLYSAHRFVREHVSDPRLQRHVIPADLDLYEVLAVADVLVTDYSSVYFDFLATSRPIVFFVPDEENYRATRGMYDLPMPGPRCVDVPELKEALTDLGKGANAYQSEIDAAREQFAAHDDGSAAARVLEWFLGEPPAAREPSSTAYIFRHSFIPNGIASSFRALTAAIGAAPKAPAVHVLVDRASLLGDEARREQLDLLPPHVRVLPRAGAMGFTAEEKWLDAKERGGKVILSAAQTRVLEAAYHREFRRVFGASQFDLACEFDGYSRFWARFVSASPARRRIAYLHNNMLEERRSKHAELATVFPLYHGFDALLSVSSSVHDANLEALAARFDVEHTKFAWANNVVDADRVRRGALEPVDQAVATFVRKASRVLVAVGRLSVEKGHDRLITQFAQVSRVGDRLIIVGGGPEEAHLRSAAHRWGVADRVLFTGQILNPYPVMALADAVLLLSRWEGQGLILLEAMILGVPVVSTDIPGPRSVLNDFGGLLVANTDQGVRDGLQAALDGRLVAGALDIERYNAEAVERFRQVVRPAGHRA